MAPHGAHDVTDCRDGYIPTLLRAGLYPVLQILTSVSASGAFKVWTKNAEPPV